MNRDIFREMGIAAILPGLTRALELLQNEVTDLRNQLEALQTPQPMRRKQGRPPGKRTTLSIPHNGDVNAQGQPLKAGYWASLTKEQRSAEMTRRREVQLGRAESQAKRKWLREQINAKNAHAPAKPSHPRDKAHPEHEAWVEKMRKVTKRTWDKLSAKQRKAQIASMVKARTAKAAKAANGAVAA